MSKKKQNSNGVGGHGHEPDETLAVAETPVESETFDEPVIPAVPEEGAGEPAEEPEARRAREWEDRCKRVAAEYENYRRRTVLERETLVSDTRYNVLRQLLPVLDNLERAVAQPCKDEAYARGVDMILQQCLEMFKKMHVEPIDAAGAAFDPNLHDAVMHIDDDSLPESTVAEVFRTGYMAGDQVLRPSMVKVAN